MTNGALTRLSEQNLNLHNQISGGGMKATNKHAALLLVLCVGCFYGFTKTQADIKVKPATVATKRVQQAFFESLPVDDGRDAKWAQQGFIVTYDDPVTRTKDGRVTHDPTLNDWMDGPAPATVNPALWLFQKLQRLHGLFQVSENVWQVSGLTASNITVVSGEKGWIIIDPGLTTEGASKAIKLVNRELGERPISAVMYTHSHVDHFGGVVGILNGQQNLPPILAPAGFVEESGSEWVMLGNIMTRHSTYQWGLPLPRNGKGYVGTGLSTDVPVGEIRLIPPSDKYNAKGVFQYYTGWWDGIPAHLDMLATVEQGQRYVDLAGGAKNAGNAYESRYAEVKANYARVKYH